MKIDTKHSSRQRSSFIIEFVWLSLVCGLVAIWGCGALTEGLMQKPGAADAVEYAEARQQAMKDPEVIEADRRYKDAHSQWLTVHKQLIEIDKKYLASSEDCNIRDEPNDYGDNLPEANSLWLFSPSDHDTWSVLVSNWTY